MKSQEYAILEEIEKLVILSMLEVSIKVINVLVEAIEEFEKESSNPNEGGYR
ncbi:hypothetical protein P9858_00835 [Niallia circulans]|uniref:hypothetical protein n=1 Tax=Niallia circulans TaxID=1397 RepID=UPI002E1C6791|nr:hypothetical protein [Niallia circulans]